MGRLRLTVVPGLLMVPSGKCGQGCPRSQGLPLVLGVLFWGVLIVIFVIGCDFEFEIFGGEVGAGGGVEETEIGLGFGIVGVFGLVQVRDEAGELGLVGGEEKRQKLVEGGVGGWRD